MPPGPGVPGYGTAVPPGAGAAVPPGPGGMAIGGPGAPPGPSQPKSNRTMMVFGIGCGAILLLGLIAAAVAVFWVRQRTNNAIEELEKLQASASALAITPEAAPVTTGAAGSATLTGDCLLAYNCCRAIAAKTAAGSGALDACEVFKTAAYPQATCTASLLGYRKAADLVHVSCQ